MKSCFIHTLIILILAIPTLTDEGSEKEISKEFIMTLKDNINHDNSISPEAKDNALKILDETLKNLDVVEQFTSKLENMKKEISSANDEINANTTYISTIEEQTQLSELKDTSLTQLVQSLINLEAERKQIEKKYEELLIKLNNRDEELKKLIQRAAELKKSISEIQIPSSS